MKNRWIVLIAVIVVVGVSVFLGIRNGSPRVLARARLPDGTERRVVGKPRVFGLLGIEIVTYKVTQDGRELGGFVDDQCSSWAEAEHKYANLTGGGLLSVP